MIIYKATNNITGKSYIGYTTRPFEKRQGEHNTSNDEYYFHNSIRKYGEHNFNWIVLERDVTDFEILEELERYWIREFDTKKPNGYNLTEGGGGINGYHLSEEAKRKIGEKNKGQIPWNKGKIDCYSEEAKRKMYESHKDKTHSEKTKRKMSENNHMKRFGQKEESKIKISEKMRKLWLIIDLNGKEFTVGNMKQFCIDNNLSYNHMKQVSAGYSTNYNGYKCKVLR